MPRFGFRGRRIAVVAVLLAAAFAAAALLGLVRNGSTSGARAPATAGTSGTATAAPVVNFRRLARKHRRAARVLTGREFEALPPHWQQRKERLERLRAAGRVAAPRARSFRAEPSASPSPSLANNFNAVDDNNLFIPPDTEGAPGLDKLVVTVNGTVRIQQKSDGSVLSTMSLNTFFDAVPGAGTVFDPHVVYDPYAGRWIVVAVSNAESPNADVLLATSENSDPGGNWKEYSVDVDPANVAWGDYPTVGFNKNWIVVSVNLYSDSGNSFTGVKAYAFDKTAAYAGSGGPPYQVFSLPYPANDDFSLAPAATYDPGADDLYLTEDYDGTGAFSTLPLRLFKLSGPVGSATLTRLSDPSGPALTTLGHWSDVTAGNVGFAPQLGSSKPIDNGDARLTQCVYRNSAVWCANTVFLPSSLPNRSAVQWYELDPATSRALQAGRISDDSGTTTRKYFAYPSIAVNKYNDALLGFSRFASDQYAGADYAYRACGDPANTFRDEAQYKAGAGSYYKTYSGTSNRWGDFSGTWVDPSDDTSMWTIQEYAKAPPSPNSGTWGTWWGALAPQAHSGPGAPSPASSDHTPGVSSTNQVVHVAWARADDCVVKYVYRWSTTPGDVPDPASDPTAPATATALASPALAPGSSWWLHLEALDGAGAPSPVVHLGPFPIVSPPPPPPPTTTTSPPPPPPACVVPAVKGKTLAGASASLQAAHCKTGAIRRRYSSRVRKGRVMSQGVVAGTKLTGGAAVSLVLSKGRAPFRPPVRVTVCYRHRTLHVTRAVWRRLHKHGATLGRCRPRP